MKRLLLVVAPLLFLTEQTFAQLAPFWQAQSGPNATLHFPVLLADSSLGASEGGAVYYFDISDSAWKLAASEALPKPYGKYPARAIGKYVKGDSLYASYKDTVFFSSNRGMSWKVAATLPSTVEYIVETRAGIVVVETSSGIAYWTSNTFETIDSTLLPEGGGRIYTDQDTLWLSSRRGNLLKSSTLGASWNASFTQDDSLYRNVLWFSGSVFVLSGYRPSPVFPYNDSNVTLWYSLDRGQAWTPMQLPSPQVIRGDNIKIASSFLLVEFGLDYYVTSNFGGSWRMLPQGGYTFVDKQGRIVRMLNTKLYVFSSDGGLSWDTLSGRGILPHIVSVQGVRASVLASTEDSLALTSDFATWRSLGPWPGILGYTRENPMRVTLNGTLVSTDTNLVFHSQSPEDFGPGILNSSGFYLIVRDDQLLETTDNGNRWLPSVQLPSTATSLVRLVGDTILVAGPWGLYRTTDVRIPFDTVTPMGGVTGAVAIDSMGRVYAAGADGKLYIGDSNAENWQAKAGPGSSKELIYTMCATPGGHLYALSYDSLQQSYFVSEYTIARNAWRRVTSGLRRDNVKSVTPTGIWYASDYIWLGSDNAGLFRSYAKVDGKAHVPQPPKPTAFYTYPSPATTTLTVHLPDYVGRTLEVSDVSGRVLQRTTAPDGVGNDVSISIEALPAGVYEISAAITGGGHVTRRFVKVR